MIQNKPRDMRLRPGGHCVCVRVGAQMFRHSITSSGGSAAPGCSPGQQGPFGHTQPLREAHTTYHCVPRPFCQPGSACCCTAGPCTQGSQQLEPGSSAGCHGELQKRWCEILQQFSPLPQPFFIPQLALLSATEDPALKRTGKGKILTG